MIIGKNFHAPFIVAVLLLLALSSYTGGVIAADGVSGVEIVEFVAPEGTVRVFLPDDLSAGDTVSAHIALYPSGGSPQVKERNLRALNGYIVETSYKSVPVEAGSYMLNVPRNSSGNMIKFTLRDGNGRVLDSSFVQVKKPDASADTSEAPTPFDYQCPLVGQAGRLIEIKGPFDGDFGTTDFRIGNVEPLVLAESPRKLVFESPSTVVGSVDLVLRERNVIVNRPFTCLQVVKIGEGGPVRVSPHSETGTLVEDAPGKSDTARGETYPRTTQTLEFGGIKAEETLDSAETMEQTMEQAARVSEAPSSSDGVGAILAKQLDSPFTGGENLAAQTDTSETVISPVTEETVQSPAVEDKIAAAAETATAEPETVTVSTVSEAEDHSSGPLAEGPVASLIKNQLDSSFVAIESAGASDAGPQSFNKGAFTVQVSSYKRRSDAEGLAEKLRRKGYPVVVTPADIPGRGRWYRVRVGSFRTKQEAREFSQSLIKKEPLIKSTFVTSYE